MLPFWLIVVIWPSKHACLIYGNLLVPWDEKGATFALLVPPGCSGAQLAGGVEKVLQGKPLKKWRCNHTHRLNVQSPPGMGLASIYDKFLRPGSPVVPVFAIWTRINQKVRIWVKSAYGHINPPQITIYAGPNVAFRCT